MLLALSAAALASAHSPEPWSFIIVGDSRGPDNGVNSVILSEVAEETVSAGVDFLLFSGDLISGFYEVETQLSYWLSVMQPVYNAGIGVYVIRGNHEDGEFFPDISVWHETFSGNYALPGNGPPGEVNLTYSFVHKNAMVVGVDQYVDIFAANQPWLDAQLTANTHPHVFVFGHLPAYRALPRPCLDFYPERRDAFWRSLADAGARVYFAGHDHFYDHARIDDGDGNIENDLHQYIVGTAGARPYTWEPRYEGDNGAMTPVNVAHAETYGYVRVDVEGSDVTLTWIARHTNNLAITGVYAAAESWSYSVASLVLLSPNGGERLVAGGDNMIQWQRKAWAGTENVRLEYFDGSAWRAINSTPVAAHTGSYLWPTAHAQDSNKCLVRLSDWEDATVSDTSDAPFTVFHCRTALPADLNGDCYVDMQDLMLLAADWLKCGNVFDPACEL
ncbi:MAG: metallophosphoesterase [Phycisphaerae bacterium]|nr:metallophosphoesterase [Phycisphaerae bacterium]